MQIHFIIILDEWSTSPILNFRDNLTIDAKLKRINEATGT